MINNKAMTVLIKQDFKAALHTDIIKLIQELYMRMLFIDRLHAEVHTKVMEANKEGVYATLNSAVQVETMITN